MGAGRCDFLEFVNFERNFMKFEKTKRKSLIKFPNFHKKTGVRPRGTPRIVFFASFFVLFRVLPVDWAIYVSGTRAKKVHFAPRARSSRRHRTKVSGIQDNRRGTMHARGERAFASR